MDTTQELLGEQLGKGGIEIVVSGTGAVSGKNCYAVAFPIETTVTNLDTGSSVSGLALIYKNNTL